MALNTDTQQMLAAAAQLESIRNDVLTSLGQYSTMNQDLGSSGFQGAASIASLRTTEDINSTGRQVAVRFQSCIDQIRNSAHQYAQMNDDNAAHLSNISTT
jgi:uncharacterized protein YukE